MFLHTDTLFRLVVLFLYAHLNYFFEVSFQPALLDIFIVKQFFLDYT